MNTEHVKIVKQGAAAIARWRLEHPGERLDLGGTDLRDADLSWVNLIGADLRWAILEGAIFQKEQAVDILRALQLVMSQGEGS